MGREWYHWVAKSSKRKGGGGGKREEGNSTVAKPQPPPPPLPAAGAVTSGCMGAVFHLFQHRHLQLHFHHHHHHSFDPTQDDPSSLQVVQAPRNSSEAEEVMVDATASLASVSETEPEGDKNSTIKMGIQINTSRRDSILLRSKSLTPRAKTGEFNNFSTLEHGNSITQINTSRMDTKLLKVPAPSSKTVDEQNSDVLSSSDCRTPSLVARLMGLDLLPEGCQSYPRPSNATSQQCNRPLSHPIAPLRSRKSTVNGNGNGRFSDLFGSLPEPPRVSLGGRRSDVDGYSYYNRRFSLQMDQGTKMQSIELSRHSCSEINGERRKSSWKVGDDENPERTRSPRCYAGQIVKQAKERVARRRFGADITNKTGEGQGREQRRDEYLLSATEKISRTPNDTKRANKTGPDGGLSSSSRTRVLEKPVTRLQQPEPVKERQILRFQVAALLQEQQRTVHEQNQKPVTRSHHGHTEVGSVNVGGKYRNLIAQRPPRLNKKDEQCVRVAMDLSRTRAGQGSEKKCKRTPLSSGLLHGNVAPSHPLKKLEKRKQVYSLKAAVPKKKVQAVKLNTTKTLQPRNDLHAPPPTPPPPPASTTDTTPTATTAEFHYISRILRAAGINLDTRVSTYPRWFSPSHPLDPALFHRLEAEEHAATSSTTTTAASPNELSLSCNRRLIFDAVDETLTHISTSTSIS